MLVADLRKIIAFLTDDADIVMQVMISKTDMIVASVIDTKITKTRDKKHDRLVLRNLKPLKDLRKEINK